MCQKIIAVLLLVSGCHAIKYSPTPQQPPAATPPDFTCPEDFGYFPHPSDCSQYYVCVFGGALLESCTGGLMYSNELQTCDWPRNVNQNYCHGNGTLETVAKKQSHGRQKTTTQSTNYVYKPIKIENYSDLSSVIATRNEQEEEGARSGRSYAQSGPEKEYYKSGGGSLTGRSVSGSSKYAPQITDYNPNDYSYAGQRYASGVNVTWQPTVATATPLATEEEDDESYYVYEDAATGSQQDVDVDYKYQSPVITTRRPITTTTTTRRPTTLPPKQKSRTSSPHSSPTRNRPTLKPKTSIVPKDLPPVRDVYLDAPSRPAPFYETPLPNTPATKCNRELCQIPDCNCGGKEIPSGLRPEETPQIVLLTFDDSVNDLNKNLYRDLFEKGRKNPNGCPISATFYVSHEWTDYSQVQNLAADGHEIASHSVSHSFGESFSQKKWEKEINGQREILSAYGGVKLSEVRGMRAPFLAIGGNNMFKMLHDVNFTYDSSMPVYENRPPSWPYTLDYKIFHDCMIPPCPTKSYPGVWEVPMVMWTDLKGGRCSMGDACSNPPTAEGVYQFLAKNFERHYTTNRAPFGLYYHAAWFTQAHHKEGFEAFLDTLVQMDDVWLVTNWQAIQWVRNPTPSSKINEFAPWNECRTREHRPPRCNHSRVCNLWHKSGVRYLKTCQNCPEQYPWTGNTGVPFTI